MARQLPQRRSRALLGLAVLALLLTVVPALPAHASVGQVEFEECLLELINADRAEAGAPALIMATDKVPAARGWSEWMRRHEFRHTTSAERDPALPDGWTSWGENIAWHSSPNIGCPTIHSMFMNSSGHRANVLGSSFRFVALGAFVDGSGWWVTELFFAAPGYQPPCDGTLCDDGGSLLEPKIEAIYAEGITYGCDGHRRVCPRDLTTLGEMAAFVTRWLDLTVEKNIDFVEADIEKVPRGRGPGFVA